MVEIVFKRDFKASREQIPADVLEKFPFAEEFYSVLRFPDATSPLDVFIDTFVDGEDVKGAYLALSEKDKEGARDFMYTMIQFRPDLVNARVVKKCLEKEESKGAKAILTSLEKIDAAVQVKKTLRNSNGLQFFAGSDVVYRLRVTTVGRRLINAQTSWVESQEYEVIQ